MLLTTQRLGHLQNVSLEAAEGRAKCYLRLAEDLKCSLRSAEDALDSKSDSGRGAPWLGEPLGEALGEPRGEPRGDASAEGDPPLGPLAEPRCSTVILAMALLCDNRRRLCGRRRHQRGSLLPCKRQL